MAKYCKTYQRRQNNIRTWPLHKKKWKQISIRYNRPMLKVKEDGELFYIHWKSNSIDILDPKVPQNVKMMKIKFVDYIFFASIIGGKVSITPTF